MRFIFIDCLPLQREILGKISKFTAGTKRESLSGKVGLKVIDTAYVLLLSATKKQGFPAFLVKLKYLRNFVYTFMFYKLETYNLCTFFI